MVDVGVGRLVDCSATSLAASSRDAMDRPLRHLAELVVAIPTDDGVVHGAFERTAPRRGSGGAAARVSPGTVWIQLALARPEAMVQCDAASLLNRYVRPLLRALTKLGAPANYFGRDWVSVAHHPAALVAFAHDGATNRALFEAIVAADARFDVGNRASYRGHEPTTLGIDPRRVADAIAHAYLEGHTRGELVLECPAVLPEEDRGDWTATAEEAIGTVAASASASGIRVGGEFMASRDAIANLEAALGTAPTADAVDRAVHEAFGAPGTALFGVTLASLRDVIVGALRARDRGQL